MSAVAAAFETAAQKVALELAQKTAAADRRRHEQGEAEGSRTL